ncbi:MAG: peptidoglycan DD-metalloendopeptidase family protein [Kiritimatiellales bacterium]|nr:peptidoglycan DD-metalloendopeptidase family protein [Kiritimatiellales bacterium]
MKKRVCLAVVCFVAANLLFCRADEERKRIITVDEATQAVGPVAAQQRFPAGFKLVKEGSIKAEGVYYHIFSSYLKDRKKWRALVFSNNGQYLGFYETGREVSELDLSALVFPRPSYVRAGDEVEGEVPDTSDSFRIEFTAAGPPETVALKKGQCNFVASPVRVPPDNPAFRFMNVAAQLVDAMNHRSYIRIRALFSEQARGKLSEEQTKTAFSNLRQKLGTVEKFDYPWQPSADTAIFPATFRQGVFGLKIMLNRNGEIDGLWFLPYATAFPDIGPHATALTLPFDGRWRVLLGGDGRTDNPHHGSRSMQHALEFVVAGRYGTTYLNEGKDNTDYFAFGRPVLAPAAGVVVGVVQGLEDNNPGSPDSFSELGNMVVIQHATNEFSVLGHLMQGSLAVKVGDQVAARQQIGRCGNSGDTTQPRIHMHMQDTPVVQTGSGYRMVFDRLLVWHEGMARLFGTYTPVGGEYIEQSLLPSEESAPAREDGKAEPVGE